MRFPGATLTFRSSSLLLLGSCTTPLRIRPSTAPNRPVASDLIAVGTPLHSLWTPCLSDAVKKSIRAERGQRGVTAKRSERTQPTNP
ncbi:hypothetical protein F5Y10DRAFT_251114 [Nemania abortiva]|nr:hypothetical protein F5Y10DRAFT_251114 [Nemania abortiva]